jgi:hypothetical protein
MKNEKSAKQTVSIRMNPEVDTFLSKEKNGSKNLKN